MSSLPYEPLPIEEGTATFDNHVLFFFLSLVLGAMLRFLCHRYKSPLPFTVLLLICGIIFGIIGSSNHNRATEAIDAFHNLDPHVFLMLFLPPLIFESAFNSNYYIMAREKIQILLLAVPGVLVASVLTGVVVHFVFVDFEWSLAEAFMFGAAISATDPVAVVSLLRELGVSPRLATMIEGESLINDGTAFVFFLIFKDIAIGRDVTAGEVTVDFLRLSVGGVAIGVAIGMLSAAWISRIFYQPDVETAITMAGSYFAFWLAESHMTGLHCSGVLAVVSYGLYLSKHKAVVSPATLEFVSSFWEMIVFVCNILVFFLSGIIIAFNFQSEFLNVVDLAYLVLLYLVLLLIRALVVVMLLPLLRRAGYNVTWQMASVVIWSGLRGAVALAIALMVKLEDNLREEVRDRFLFLTGGIVFLTCFINGTTTERLLNKLKLNIVEEAASRMHKKALMFIDNASEDCILNLQNSPFYAETDWQHVLHTLPAYVPDIPRMQDIIIDSTDIRTPRPLSRTSSNQNISNLARQMSKDNFDDRFHGMNNEMDLLDPIEDVELLVIEDETKRHNSTNNLNNLHNRQGRILPSKSKMSDLSITGKQDVTEINKRYISFMKASFEKQFEDGLTTRNAQEILVNCCESAADRDCDFEDDANVMMKELWCHITSHLVTENASQFYLTWCGAFDVTKFVFLDAVALSFELLRAYSISLDSVSLVPEFTSLSGYADIEETLSDLRLAVHDKWNLFRIAYPEIHTTIQTRHATQELMFQEKTLIQHLREIGVLNLKETEMMIHKINESIFNIMNSPASYLKTTDRRDKVEQLAILKFLPLQLRNEIVKSDFLHKKKGEYFFYDEKNDTTERSDRIYFIISGFVKVIPYHILKTKPQTHFRSVGSLVGLYSYLTGYPVLPKYECQTDVEYIEFSPTLLNKMMRKYKVRKVFWQLAAESMLLIHFRNEFMDEYLTKITTHSNRFSDVDQHVRYVCLNSRVFEIHAKDSKQVYLVQEPTIILTGSAVLASDEQKQVIQSPHFFKTGTHNVQFSPGSVVLSLPGPQTDKFKVRKFAAGQNTMKQNIVHDIGMVEMGPLANPFLSNENISDKYPNNNDDNDGAHIRITI